MKKKHYEITCPVLNHKKPIKVCFHLVVKNDKTNNYIAIKHDLIVTKK